jgi:hypothetical protein
MHKLTYNQDDNLGTARPSSHLVRYGENPG